MNVNNATSNPIQRPIRADDGAITVDQQAYSSITSMLTEASNTNNTFQSTHSVPRISACAIYGMVNRDTFNMASWESNIKKVSNYLDRVPYTREIHDSLNWSVSKVLQFSRNPQLTLEIASERVKNGESCSLVAREHGIEGLDCITLEMIAVNGPAGDRMRKGENIYSVLNAHGISSGGEAHRALRDIGIRSDH